MSDIPCDHEIVDLRFGYVQDSVDGCRDALGVIVLSTEQSHGAIVVIESLLMSLFLRR